jgi:putative oxidoreductase
MKTKINNMIRIALGLGLLLFGLDKFFEYIPHNHVMTEDLIAAFTGLMANKFILPTVGVVEAISGILLLTRKYSIIGLLLMIPVTYGIIAFHIAVDLEGIIPGLIVAIMHIYLLSLRKTTLINLVTEHKVETKP